MMALVLPLLRKHDQNGGAATSIPRVVCNSYVPGFNCRK